MMMMIESTRWIKMKTARTPQHKTRPGFSFSYQYQRCVRPGFPSSYHLCAQVFFSSCQRCAQVFSLPTSDVPKFSSSYQRDAQFFLFRRTMCQDFPLPASNVPSFPLPTKDMPRFSPFLPATCPFLSSSYQQ